MIKNIKNSQIPKNLQNRKNLNDKRFIPKPYRDVAKALESQYAEHMINQMQKSIHKTKPDSTAENYYNSLLSHERAKAMAENDQGLGIQNLILNQIYPQRKRNELNYNAYLKQEEKRNNLFSRNKIQKAETPAMVEEASNE